MESTPNKNDGNGSNISAYALIIIGGYFLLKKLGWIPNLLPLIAEWWSLILVGVGVFILIRNAVNKKS